LNRPAIVPTTYMDVLDGTGKPSVFLRYWPVQTISSCLVDDTLVQPSLGPSQAGYILERASLTPPGSMQRLSLRSGVFSRGIQNISISYFAGYQLTERVTVPESGPFSIDVEASLGHFAADQGVRRGDASTLLRVDQSPAPGEYRVTAGTYTFNAADAGLPMEITYGYVPFDIALAAKEWAAERYSYHGRIGQSSKSLGGQETVAFIVKDIPEFVSRILQPYRCVLTP